ncbi:mariner Mos1 transposase [Trichonephila clavipes]|nr:mariner Mos1 transposase [Trichonephila clavipes]
MGAAFAPTQQKQCREDVSIKNLAKFHSNEAKFLRRFITMNETWVHHFTPEIKEQWAEKGELNPKKAKNVPSAVKVTASGLGDARGIIFIEYLDKENTIDGEYCVNILQRLSEEIKQKKPHLACKKVVFHQDNEPACKSVIAMSKINELKFKLLPHIPYSADLALSDYFLFPNLKKWLSGQRFPYGEEVTLAVNGYFEEQDSSYYNMISLSNIAGKSV